jgi:transcriptional regulator with XRE-family HTH domain
MDKVTLDREKFAGAIRATCPGTLTSFAKGIGMSPSTMTRAASGKSSVGADTFLTICRAIGRPAEDFLDPPSPPTNWKKSILAHYDRAQEAYVAGSVPRHAVLLAIEDLMDDTGIIFERRAS